MKNIPEKIYLHLGDPDDLGDRKDFNELGGVGWSDERINENDVEYVRKDTDVVKSDCIFCGGSPIEKTGNGKHCPYCDKYW